MHINEVNYNDNGVGFLQSLSKEFGSETVEIAIAIIEKSWGGAFTKRLENAALGGDLSADDRTYLYSVVDLVAKRAFG